jgi:uncharacterized protein YdbL (DUF1318 family)
MKKRLLLSGLAILTMPGCIHIKVDPIQVTADVNLNPKVDNDLDNSFTQAKTATGVIPRDLHDRFVSRRSGVDALRASGVARENNQGFLEQNGGDDKATQLIQDENADRAKAFAIIAQKDGTTADAVGRERAKKIAEKVKPGTWIQAEDGTWAQKQP